MKFDQFKGAAGKQKVMAQEKYKSLFSKSEITFFFLSDEENRPRHFFNFSERWYSGCIYYPDVFAETMTSDFRYYRPISMKENEVFTQLYSSYRKSGNFLCLRIVNPGIPDMIIEIEPKMADIWKIVIDKFVSENAVDIIRPYDETDLAESFRSQREDDGLPF